MLGPNFVHRRRFPARLNSGVVTDATFSYPVSMGCSYFSLFYYRLRSAHESPLQYKMERSTLRLMLDHCDDDPMAVIDPVWWRGNIYDGPEAYEGSLGSFTKAQRFVWAMLWYDAEVNNGGHDQFYGNSTGIVWRDALSGFEAIGAPEAAAILRESANRLGKPVAR